MAPTDSNTKQYPGPRHRRWQFLRSEDPLQKLIAVFSFDLSVESSEFAPDVKLPQTRKVSPRQQTRIRFSRKTRHNILAALVDFRFGDGCSAFEKIEVASFVGLPNVLQEQFAVAARINAVLWPPRAPTPRQFLVAHAHRQLARGDVQLHNVTLF